MKITTVLEGFWLEKRLQFSVRTVENYTRIFTQLIEHWGNVEFEGVTTINIRRHLDYLEREQRLTRRSVYAVGVGFRCAGVVVQLATTASCR